MQIFNPKICRHSELSANKEFATICLNRKVLGCKTWILSWKHAGMWFCINVWRAIAGGNAGSYLQQSEVRIMCKKIACAVWFEKCVLLPLVVSSTPCASLCKPWIPPLDVRSTPPSVVQVPWNELVFFLAPLGFCNASSLDIPLFWATELFVSPLLVYGLSTQHQSHSEDKRIPYCTIVPRFSMRYHKGQLATTPRGSYYSGGSLGPFFIAMCNGLFAFWCALVSGGSGWAWLCGVAMQLYFPRVAGATTKFAPRKKDAYRMQLEVAHETNCVDSLTCPKSCSNGRGFWILSLTHGSHLCVVCNTFKDMPWAWNLTGWQDGWFPNRLGSTLV